MKRTKLHYSLFFVSLFLAFFVSIALGQNVETSITPEDFPALKNPSMRWASGNFSKDPSVVRFQDRYLLYFSFPPQKVGNREFGWTIGVAESSDLIHWKFLANILPMQECDEKGLCAPCAKVISDKVFLFYQTYGNGPKDAICCAWSKDGTHFRPHSQNPIFHPKGTWTNGRAIDAELISFKNQWFLYAATRDPEGKKQKLVVATAEIMDENASDPEKEFGPERWKLAFDGSILEPELNWETNCIEAPTIIEKNGKLYMFYAGGFNNDPQQIGLAISDDGIVWRRVWNLPFIPNGPTGQWNESESGHPGVFVDEKGQTWLFFQGNKTKGKDWFLSRVKIGWESDSTSKYYPKVLCEEF